jgi:hypothetical protein
LATAAADTALMIGVAEWLGYTSTQSSVYELQLAGIREVSRVLRRDGLLIIGTKNRIFPRYAWSDGQLRKPLVNLLPRNWASWVSRRLWDTDYRGHIYTYWGWKNLAREGGFEVLDTLIPIYNYQFPLLLLKPWEQVPIRARLQHAAASLSGELRSAALKTGSAGRLWYYRALAAVGLLGLGAGSFLLICRKASASFS